MNLYNHEWEKHGTCAGTTPQGYLAFIGWKLGAFFVKLLCQTVLSAMITVKLANSDSTIS